MPTEAMVLNTFDAVKVADLKPYEEKSNHQEPGEAFQI